MYVSESARTSAFKVLWEEGRISYVAILYCDRDGEIAYVPVKVNNGTLYLEHEQWPLLDRVPFKSLESLITALEDNGFKQVAGEMDTVEMSSVPFPVLPRTLQEQLIEPGIFMLDRHYFFQIQFEPLHDGKNAFPVNLDKDSVYIASSAVKGLNETRYDNLDSLLKALGNVGRVVRVLDWGVRTNGVRLPKIKWV